MEEWKDIKGYEGLYQVSNLGRVRGLDRIVNGKGNKPHFKKGRILAQRVRSKKYQYLSVNLSKDDKLITYALHRLVAIAFIPNPENKPQVNHIDENRLNNCVDNLEWVTNYENMHHNSLIQNINKPAKKAVVAYDKDGNIVMEFESIAEVKKHGFSASAVSQNISGKIKTSGGYVWKLK